tara:strand:+ start:916 stop:1704 length:789 start_codon:yes stop_codon:yes gene_type:complete
MKITLFTSNKNRHNYFINLLSEISSELFVVQECQTIFPGVIPGDYPVSPTMNKYFQNVNDVQLKLFGNSYVNNFNKNIKILPIIYGDLNQCTIKFLSDFLESDIYIIFGSSYIKSKLLNFLVEQKAINIHAGVSPYYRGADCNFWALYDNNPHLVGSTIHFLSKGIDSGPILYHAMSNLKENPYEYSMSTIKSAFHSITKKIQDNSIFNIEPINQKKNKEIRYSRKKEFNEEVVKKYFEKKINLDINKSERSLLKEPFFFEN